MQWLRKRFKRPLCALCAFLAVFLGVGNAYSTAVHAEAVTAGISVMQVLYTLLLSAGASYVTTDMLSSSWTGWTDGNNALDEDWQRVYDSMEDVYDNNRSEQISSGGGSNNKGDPNYLNTFAEMVAVAATSGKIDCSNDGIWETLQIWANQTCKDAYDLGACLYDYINPDFTSKMDYFETYNLYQVMNQYKYHFLDLNSVWFEFYFSNEGSFDGSALRYNGGVYFDAYRGQVENNLTKLGNGYHLLMTEYNYVAVLNTFPDAAGNLNNDVDIWTSTGTGNPDDLIAYPPYSNSDISGLNIPTLQAIQAMISNALNPDGQVDPDKVPDAVQQMLNQIAIHPDVNPDPGTDPNPGGNPETNPSTEPATEPSSESEKLDQEASDGGFLANGLSNVFPFCIPWDLVRAFKLLVAPAETPHITWEFKVDRIGLDYTFDIDFSQFESLAAIFRTLETIGFIIALIMATNKLIKH